MGLPGCPRVYTQRPPHTALPRGLPSRPAFSAHPLSASQQRCVADPCAGGAWRAGPPPRAAARPSARLRGSPPRGTCQHQPAADKPPGVVAHTGAGVKTKGSDTSDRAELTTRRAHQRGHPSPSARNASRQAPPSAPDPQHKPASHSRQAGGAPLPTAGPGSEGAQLQPNPGSTHALRARYTDTEPHTPHHPPFFPG